MRLRSSARTIADIPAGWAARVALALAVTGLGLVMLGVSTGLVALLAGWCGLAVADRRWLVLSLVGAVPLTTFGWTAEIATISGRTLDLRLVVTFAVAAIVAGALLVSRGSVSRAEAAFGLLVGWSVVSGIVASDSPLTWAPWVARLVAYAGAFALARRYLVQHGDLRFVTAVLAVAFAIPTLAGLVAYVLGDAPFINEAARAATPGGRGPISLAFAGQVSLALGFALATATGGRPARASWLAVAMVGGAGLLASATRLVTVTAWLIVAGFAALRSRWLAAAVITVLVASASVARPDLLGRFIDTFGVAVSTASPGGEQDAPDDEVELDDSFRFRLFVWSVLIDEWAEQPLTGIGPGMTAIVVAERAPDAQRAAPHNDYLGIFAELSMPGLALYIAVQCLVIRALVTRIRAEHDPRRRDVMLMAVLLYGGSNVLGALNNPIYFFDMQVGVWALVGTALAVPSQEVSRGRAGGDRQ